MAEVNLLRAGARQDYVSVFNAYHDDMRGSVGNLPRAECLRRISNAAAASHHKEKEQEEEREGEEEEDGSEEEEEEDGSEDEGGNKNNAGDDEENSYAKASSGRLVTVAELQPPEMLDLPKQVKLEFKGRGACKAKQIMVTSWAVDSTRDMQGEYLREQSEYVHLIFL